MRLHQLRHGKTAVDQALRFSTDKRSCTVDAETIISLFYGACTASQQAQAKTAIRVQASLAFSSKVNLSQDDFDKTPKSYIRCTRDKIIPESQYQMMLEAQPCDSVYFLDSDHSPMLSQPKKLAEILVNIVELSRLY